MIMSRMECYKRYGRIYFRKKDIPRKRQVLKKMGAKKDTFAGNMISRVYDYYFKGAVNFRKEYLKYYHKEFSSIEMFIEEHFNIECNDAAKLAKNDYSMKECSLNIERNVETLNYDESFERAFSDVVGGLEDEDQDGVYYE